MTKNVRQRKVIGTKPEDNTGNTLAFYALLIAVVGIIVTAFFGFLAIYIVVSPPGQTPPTPTLTFNRSTSTWTISPTIKPTESSVQKIITTKKAESTPKETVAKSPQPTPVVDGGRLVFFDEFGEDSFLNWNPEGNVVFTNSTVEISNGEIARLNRLPKGSTMVFLLKGTSIGEFDVYLSEQAGNNDMIGIGIRGTNLIIAAHYNNQWVGGASLEGNLSFSLNNWYIVTLQLTSDDYLYMRIWEKEDGSKYREKKLLLGSNWSDKLLYPRIIVQSGKMVVDYYQELEMK